MIVYGHCRGQIRPIITGVKVDVAGGLDSHRQRPVHGHNTCGEYFGIQDPAHLGAITVLAARRQVVGPDGLSPHNDGGHILA